MHNSITFISGQNSRNTWDDWGLVPESPPMIELPKVKANFVEIPGRINGPIDMATIPLGVIPYQRISGQWSFVVYEDYWTSPDRMAVYNAVRSFLHGKHVEIRLEEDPTHYFEGRCEITAPKRQPGVFLIAVSYNLDPARYNVSDDSIDTTWINYVD